MWLPECSTSSTRSHLDKAMLGNVLSNPSSTERERNREYEREKERLSSLRSRKRDTDGRREAPPPHSHGTPSMSSITGPSGTPSMSSTGTPSMEDGSQGMGDPSRSSSGVPSSSAPSRGTPSNGAPSKSGEAAYGRRFYITQSALLTVKPLTLGSALLNLHLPDEFEVNKNLSNEAILFR